MKMQNWNECSVQTDEEFIAWYEARSRRLVIFPVLGFFALVFGVLNEALGWINNSHMSGVITGVGSALLVLGIALSLRWHRVKRNAVWVHKMRLKYTDERNQELGRRALASAAYITILACFAAMLVVGWFSSVAFWCFYGMMFFVLFAYLGCYLYYNKKM